MQKLIKYISIRFYEVITIWNIEIADSFRIAYQLIFIDWSVILVNWINRDYYFMQKLIK